MVSANKSMKTRHWDQIGALTKKKINIDEEGFTLKDVMNTDLLLHKEEIEVNM